jgi:hypothetical protein
VASFFEEREKDIAKRLTIRLLGAIVDKGIDAKQLLGANVNKRIEAKQLLGAIVNKEIDAKQLLGANDNKRIDAKQLLGANVSKRIEAKPDPTVGGLRCPSIQRTACATQDDARLLHAGERPHPNQ